MALKLLILRSKLETAKKSLEELRAKDGDFATREAELEQAIDELTEEVAEADRQELEKQVDDFQKEKDGHEEAKTSLENEIKNIEEQMAEEEKRSAKVVEKPKNEITERGIGNMNNTRTKFFGMNTQERDAFFAREDVKDFISQVRTCIKEKRALSNVGVIIPQNMLELLKEKVSESSKLVTRVNLKPVAGTARQRIMGSIPEAIWTEALASLNELSLTFNDAEVDGYKVGGFIPVHNAIIEDNDVNLVTEILNALGKAIGKGLDKAIVYGTGKKMPMGFVTRLAQTSKPDAYSATARAWKDLHTSNILRGTGATGNNLFKEITTRSGVIVNDYSEDGLVWLMNRKTHLEILAQSIDKNINAAIVAGMNDTMPVVGGTIIELPFIPDNNVAFGYMDMYLLAERGGTTLGQSEHVRFIEDQTVFKGTARYDGQPIIAEAFGLLTINTSAPVTSVDFAPDTANTTADAGEAEE